MTDNIQELDEVLDTYDMSLVCSECEHPYCQRRKWLFRQAILDWHNKQVLAIIGEDEPTEIWYETEITVASGKKPVTKRVREKTHANAEVHHRNELRAEQRNKLKEAK